MSGRCRKDAVIRDPLAGNDAMMGNLHVCAMSVHAGVLQVFVYEPKMLEERYVQHASGQGTSPAMSEKIKRQNNWGSAKKE